MKCGNHNSDEGKVIHLLEVIYNHNINGYKKKRQEMGDIMSKIINDNEGFNRHYYGYRFDNVLCELKYKMMFAIVLNKFYSTDYYLQNQQLGITKVKPRV